MRFRPADAAIIAGSLASAALITAAQPRDWEPAALAFTALAMAPFLLAGLERRWPHVVTHQAAAFYPAAWSITMYGYLNTLCDSLHRGLVDARLQEIDRALFHVQPSVWLAPHLGPWLSGFLMTCYASYYLWAVVVGVIYQARHDEASFSRWTLIFTLYILATFASYCLIPAEGPRFMLAGAFRQPIQGVWAGYLVDLFGRSPFSRDCFPSGHTALTLMVLYEAWKHQRKFFWVALPMSLGLIVSTVACRFHYGIDLIAAVPLAVALTWLGDILFQPARQAAAPWRGFAPDLSGDLPDLAVDSYDSRRSAASQSRGGRAQPAEATGP
jgi:membrane-associated phospholipid phosphatase